MATGIDVINDAMFAIGASSDINPATPALINASFRRLTQWIEQMTAKGIFLGLDENGDPAPITLPLPSIPAEELGNAPATDLSLGAGLAPWIAPLFRLPLDQPTRVAAKQAMDYLYTISAMADLPQWPSTLPIGGGNKRGPNGRTYMPRPVDPFPYLSNEDDEPEEGVTP
jgi:hypothetical protein